jgi:PAS domain S-box-containing protein
MNSVALLGRLEQRTGEAFLAALVKSSDDAITGTTPDGAIVLWNEAAERLYGYSAGEILGRDAAVLIPPDRTQELSDLLVRVRGGETVRLEPCGSERTEHRYLCRSPLRRLSTLTATCSAYP